MSDDRKTEQMIQERGLTAPRITPDHIDGVIEHAHYHRVPGTTTTLCSLVLTNGFVVTGESACASAANFDEDLGRSIARRNAREKIWALEGYLLRDHLYRTGK
ncbi:Gp49 family protein [Asaia sp. HN010]|uniref:Gp49 family protein n=1 Tax=Asaia sp. HN010 TaxID=3081233 RepID=UPI0030177862